MTVVRSVLAVAATSLLGVGQAWHIDLPPCLDEFQPFVYSGCFADGDGVNALAFRSDISSKGMTVEKCVAECKGNGYRYAGLEYYGECFCGATVDGPELDNSECTLPCDGDHSQTCGGNGKLSVYQDPTFPEAPEDVTVDDYKYLGCYTDDSSEGRTLSWPMKLDAATFTTETCLSACKEDGYPFAGTEFGKECWCGVVLANNTAKVDDSECNKPCKGDSSETCGGSARLSLYVASELESLEPCGYSEPSVSTTITSKTSKISTMTSTTSEHHDTTTTTIITTTKTTDKHDTTTSTSKHHDTTTTTWKHHDTTTTTHTTSAPLCTSTEVVPPTCEYKCGNWCAPPVPDWDDEHGCKDAYKTCARQIASCFKEAGWPGALDCFDFSKWCNGINDYCWSDCRGHGCSKNDCWKKHHHGGGGNPGKTTTSVFPCPATTTTTKAAPTTTTAPTTSCPPEPTNICTQPSSDKYDFGPGHPVANISLPLVTCNDLEDQWRWHPLKLYTNQDSRRCPSYTHDNACGACEDACKEQYEQCKDVYVKTCKDKGWKSYFHKREAELETRWGWGSWGNFWGHDNDDDNDGGHDNGGGHDHDGWGSGDHDWKKAEKKCEVQYKKCREVNKDVEAGDRCTTWGKGY